MPGSRDSVWSAVALAPLSDGARNSTPRRKGAKTPGISFRTFAPWRLCVKKFFQERAVPATAGWADFRLARRDEGAMGQ